MCYPLGGRPFPRQSLYPHERGQRETVQTEITIDTLTPFDVECALDRKTSAFGEKVVLAGWLGSVVGWG
jgi:hypothetical protein